MKIIKTIQYLLSLSNNNNINNDIIKDIKEHHDNHVQYKQWIDCPEKKETSIVTIGDGSVHNHHFWPSYHLAHHAKHSNIKCPIVFGISDDGLSISYCNNGYIDTIFNNNDSLIPTYVIFFSLLSCMHLSSIIQSRFFYGRRAHLKTNSINSISGFQDSHRYSLMQFINCP